MRLRLAVVAVLGVLGIAALTATFACDDKDDVSQTVPQGSVTPGQPSGPARVSTAGTEGGPEPLLKTPAGQYGPSADETPGGPYKVNPNNTFDYTVTSFASASGLFTDPSEGQKKAGEWKMADGTHVEMVPDGQLAGVIGGKYYLALDIFLFGTVDGAKQAFDYIQKQTAAVKDTEPQQFKGLGNQAVGYRLKSGTVGTSDVGQVYHRFILRRGTLVAVVQTTGAETHMTIDQAREIAVIIDDKALGKRKTVLPTPVPTPIVPPVTN